MDDPQGLLSSPEPPDTNSTVTGDAWQPSQSSTNSEESGHEYDEDHDVWTTSENGSIDLQVQTRRHLDEDIEKILELAAPGVTATERYRIVDLVPSYRDVFALNDDREWLGGRREMGPRDVKSAYFHNLIGRWKKLALFGEDEVDRGWAASEGEVPKQCWCPPEAMGESDNWTVPQQDYRHLVDKWKRQEER